MTVYSPAQVAERTGFSLDTRRYDERIGLLAGIARTPGRRRSYTDDDLAWLGVLRCLRETGMPIADMLRFARLVQHGEETIPERLAVLEDHDRRIEEKIAALRAEQRRVQEKIRGYRSQLGHPGCRCRPSETCGRR